MQILFYVDDARKPRPVLLAPPKVQNTARLGDKWAKRVNAGNRIEAVACDGQNKTRIAMLKVAYVHKCTWAQAVNPYVGDNHGALLMGLSGGEAKKWLWTELTACYDTGIGHHSEITFVGFTVERVYADGWVSPLEEVIAEKLAENVDAPEEIASGELAARVAGARDAEGLGEIATRANGALLAEIPSYKDGDEAPEGFSWVNLRVGDQVVENPGDPEKESVHTMDKTGTYLVADYATIRRAATSEEVTGGEGEPDSEKDGPQGEEEPIKFRDVEVLVGDAWQAAEFSALKEGMIFRYTDTPAEELVANADAVPCEPPAGNWGIEASPVQSDSTVTGDETSEAAGLAGDPGAATDQENYDSVTVTGVGRLVDQEPDLEFDAGKMHPEAGIPGDPIDMEDVKPDEPASESSTESSNAPPKKPATRRKAKKKAKKKTSKKKGSKRGRG